MKQLLGFWRTLICFSEVITLGFTKSFVLSGFFIVQSYLCQVQVQVPSLVVLEEEEDLCLEVWRVLHE